ncbi:MAG TPA: AAA family ATPase, partial [Acidimicrobiales bacterium]|nr:AAA family ATPase [Acidimicrobiales bacterium]
MLCELRVSQLGVIEDLTLVLGPGLTALTGETGAGKTLVVEAIDLLIGGRAGGVLVRPGAVEAIVEGRFDLPETFEANDDGGPFGPQGLGPDHGAEERLPTEPDQPDQQDKPNKSNKSSKSEGEPAGTEVVLGRVVPGNGRSRAYMNGRMATVGALSQLGERLVDLHGQHAHQSLFTASAQRDALDLYAEADRRPRDSARWQLRQVEEAMAKAGGDTAGRAREIELLRYQLAELGSAGLTSATEDDELAAEEERLARAAAHRAVAQAAYEGLSGEDQVQDALGKISALMAGHPPLASVDDRIRGVAAELADIAGELRGLAESLEEDPERLAEVVARRALLRDLRRKYAGAGLGAGGNLEDVLVFQTNAIERLEYLEDLESVGAQLEQDRAKCRGELHRAAEELGQARRGGAASLGAAVE